MIASLFKHFKHILFRKGTRRAGKPLAGFLRGRRTQSLEEMKREPSLRMDQVCKSVCEVATSNIQNKIFYYICNMYFPENGVNHFSFSFQALEEELNYANQVG